MPKEKIFDELVPLQLKLEPHQIKALREEAKKEGMSMSAYIRRFINAMLKET